jgi:hypothetical protein
LQPYVGQFRKLKIKHVLKENYCIILLKLYDMLVRS